MRAQSPLIYVSVSAACLLLHNVVLIAAHSIGVGLALAVLVSFASVASVGYVLHAVFTFRQPLSMKRLARYSVAMSANIPISYATTWFWYAFVGLQMEIAAPIASACMLALNFVLGRWAIAAPDPKTAEVQ